MGGQGSGKKKATAAAVNDGPDDSKPDIQHDLDPVDQVISGLLDLEKDSTAYLYRLWPPMPDLPTDMPRYISQYKGPFELDDIQKKHGGGVYKIRIKRVDSAGNRHYKTFQFAIEGDPIMPKVESAGKAEIDSDIVSRLDKLEGMITAMTTGANTRGASDTIEELKKLQLMKEILKGDGSSPEAMIGLFTKGIEVAKDLSGGDDWAGLIKELAPEFLKFMQHKKPTYLVRRKPSAAEPAATGPPPEDHMKPSDGSEDREAGNGLFDYLADTVRGAIDNNDNPETVARVLSRMLSEEEFTALVGIEEGQIELFCRTYLSDKPTAKECIDKILEILKKEE